MFGCKSSILDDPTTSIHYSLAEESYVKLTIENSYNTTVATLVDGVRSAGAHMVNFDSSNLAEGVYFYTIEAKGTNDNSYYKIVKQMLLVK